MSVCARTAAEMMPFYYAGKTAAFAHADHVNKLFTVENVHQNFCADFDSVAIAGRFAAFRRLFSCSGFGAIHHCDFAHELYRRQIMLAEVSLHGLGYILAFYKLNQANLRGFITVFIVALNLRNYAWSGLQNRDRVNFTVVIKDLRHADFFAQNSVNHFFSLIIPVPIAASRNCRLFLLQPLAFSSWPLAF